MNKYNMNKSTIAKKSKDLIINHYSLLRIVYDIENENLYGIDFYCEDPKKQILSVSELMKRLESYAPYCITDDYNVQQYRDFKRTIDNYVKEYVGVDGIEIRLDIR